MQIPSKTKLILLMVATELAMTSSAFADNTHASEPIENRRPLPLLQMMADHQKQMMRDHLGAVQEIVTALAADDFEAVERAAGRLGYSDEIGRICTRFGAASPAFADQALSFHHTADGIAVAARERSHQHVLDELSTTLQACKACHAAWKQQVVDERTWNRLTAMPQSSVSTHQ
ncbi:MAG: hypothetical protein ACLQJ0_13900 [Steroidobacteraceae bacterium]